MSTTIMRDPATGIHFEIEDYVPPLNPVRLDFSIPRDDTMFARLAPDTLAVLPEGFSAPLDCRTSYERIINEREARMWAKMFDVPNRLFGATITPEGDAI